MSKLLLTPLSWLFAIVISIRHKLFDWGVLPSVEYDIPIICVGNITVGGTGKTPMTEALVRHLSTTHTIGVLSRGYKRRTKGYLEVDGHSSFLKSGDEPKQIKLKFPEIVVSVCANRREGIARMRAEHPEIDLIILDDALQHRYVEPWISILLMDYTRPIYNDHLLPVGSLRDTFSQVKRANFVVITKCPSQISAIDMRIVRSNLKLFPYQYLFFTRNSSKEPVALFEEGRSHKVVEGANVILMSGIGNPKAFENEISKRYNVRDHLIYPDHYAYRKSDIARLEALLTSSPEGTVAIVTEKDSVKLTNRKNIPQSVLNRIYYLPIELEFIAAKDVFLNKLDGNVKENPKYGLHH